MYPSLITHMRELSFSELSNEQCLSIGRICEKSFNPRLAPHTMDGLKNVVGRALLCFSSRKCQPCHLIGFALTRRLPDSRKVFLLAVTPSNQKLGIGTVIMQYLFEKSKQEQCYIHLEYDASQWKLCRFYSSFHPIIADDSHWSHLFLPRWFSTTPIFDPATSLKALKNKTYVLIDTHAEKQARYIWYYKRLEVIFQLGTLAFLCMAFYIFSTSSTSLAEMPSNSEPF